MSSEVAFEVGRLYQPIKNIADTLVSPTRDLFVKLPGIVAYFPMSIYGLNGLAIDHTSNGANLTPTGTPTRGYDGDAYTHCGAAIDYYSSTSTIFDITGLETQVASGIRGMTMGCWVNVQATPVASAGLITKDQNTPQRSYAMVYTTVNTARAVLSGNGTTVVTLDSPTVPLSTWTFLAYRFTPGVELAIFANSVKNTLLSGIPASIFVSTAPFEVSRYIITNTRIVNAYYRDVWICAAALSDGLIEQIRQFSLPSV